MARVYEDEFMEVQSQIVSLCVEFAGNRADKVYAYGSIEESSISFNAFFNIDGRIKTTNNIAADPDAIWDFLDLGESDLEKIRQICIHYGKPVPTELKIRKDGDRFKRDFYEVVRRGTPKHRQRKQQGMMGKSIWKR